MLDFDIATYLQLATIAFIAGMVRGFSGFALSAVMMAAATLIIPPIELIPICWWLELAASALMVRNGWKEADRQLVFILFVGSIIGIPIGMALTTHISTELSSIMALLLVGLLALVQLMKLRLAFLNSKAGLSGSGITAGIVTGVAGIGGMIIAIYVLSTNKPTQQIRASLVMYLFISSLTSLITYLSFGVMDQTAMLRGLTLIIPCGLGVLLGTWFFSPRWQPYYRPFCLTLLIVLASYGLLALYLK